METFGDILRNVMSELKQKSNIIDAEYEDVTDVEDDYSENEEEVIEEDESFNLD